LVMCIFFMVSILLAFTSTSRHYTPEKRSWTSSNGFEKDPLSHARETRRRKGTGIREQGSAMNLTPDG
jgi:hypothetical protein